RHSAVRQAAHKPVLHGEDAGERHRRTVREVQEGREAGTELQDAPCRDDEQADLPARPAARGQHRIEDEGQRLRHRAVAVQYVVEEDNVADAYYRLANSEEQIRSYVFDTVRSALSGLTLDTAFESKDDIAENVERRLS